MRVPLVYSFAFLYYLIYAALSLILPLYLFSKNFSLSIIASILSILPFIALFVRILFAALADYYGTKPILILSAIFIVLALPFYTLAHSLFFVVIGKVMEALSFSAFWGVIRTGIYERVKDKKAGITALEGLIILAEFSGRVLVGFFIYWLGYYYSFLSIFGLTFPLFLLSLFIPKVSHRSSKDFLEAFTKQRSKKFWKISFVMSIEAFTFIVLLNFIFPTYFSKIGVSSTQIGVLLGSFQLIAGLSIFSFLKFKEKTLLYLSTLFSLPFFFLTSFPKSLLISAILILGTSEGIRMVFFERMIVKAVKRSKYVSVDIGFLHIPFRAVEALSMMIAGSLIEQFGFFPVFCLIGLATLIYNFLSSTLLKP